MRILINFESQQQLEIVSLAPMNQRS